MSFKRIMCTPLLPGVARGIRKETHTLGSEISPFYLGWFLPKLVTILLCNVKVFYWKVVSLEKISQAAQWEILAIFGALQSLDFVPIF